MLVMSDKQQPKHVLTNIDSYIPFSIEFSDSGLADLYWRCGNGKTCLFELGLSNTGEVINITLVSINSSNTLKTIINIKFHFLWKISYLNLMFQSGIYLRIIQVYLGMILIMNYN